MCGVSLAAAGFASASRAGENSGAIDFGVYWLADRHGYLASPEQGMSLDETACRRPL